MSPHQDEGFVAPEREATHRGRAARAIGALWAGILLAPAAFLLDLGWRFALVEWACASGRGFTLWLVLLAGAALAGFGGWRAWANWRSIPTPPDTGTSGDDTQQMRSTSHTLSSNMRTDGPPPLGRSRFMALAGIAVSAFFLTVILASILPSLLLHPCT